MNTYIRILTRCLIAAFLFGSCQTSFGFGMKMSDEKAKQCKKDKDCYCSVYGETYQLAADVKSGGGLPPTYALAYDSDVLV